MTGFARQISLWLLGLLEVLIPVLALLFYTTFHRQLKLSKSSIACKAHTVVLNVLPQKVRWPCMPQWYQLPDLNKSAILRPWSALAPSKDLESLRLPSAAVRSRIPGLAITTENV